MAEKESTSQPQEREGEVGTYVVNEPIPSSKPPADGAEGQKPTPDADDEGAKPAAKEGDATPEAEAPATPEQQEQKKQSKFQRRLDRQKAARVAAETEARMLREQIAKLEAAKAAPPADTGEPKRNDIDPATGQEYDYETYLRRLAKWEAKQAASTELKSERDERAKAEGSKSKAAAQEELAKNWTEREKAFQAATKDYADVVTPYLEDGLGDLSDVARMAIAESELGPQLLHHLAQNDEVAERIAGLSPTRQVAELGKLEASMAAPPAKKAPSAPPPISGVKGNASAVQGYRENMSDEEYRAMRKAQGARWAR